MLISRGSDHSTRRLIRDDDGATMVEYSLAIALIALVAFLGVTAFGVEVLGLFDNVDLLDALS